MVASHTAVLIGTAKWLEVDCMVWGKACLWVGDIVCLCPLHISKVLCVGVALTSHFAVPKGTAVWLATFV